MQEKVLGTIIIGGIAIVGVIWAMCEGIPQTVKAKNTEKKLESALVERVNAKLSDENKVSSLDIKRVNCDLEIIKDPSSKFSGKTITIPLISMEGYNNKNEQFKVEYYGQQKDVLDFINKLKSSGTAYDELKGDLYQNYTLTTADLLYSIVTDEKNTFVSYSILDGYYGRMETPKGTTYVVGVDQEVENAKSTSDADIKATWEGLNYGETTTDYYTVKGVVRSVSRLVDSSSKVSLVVKLETEGVDDEKKLFEIYNAKIDTSKVTDEKYSGLLNGDSTTITNDSLQVLVGTTLTAYGTLSKNACYTSLYTYSSK